MGRTATSPVSCWSSLQVCAHAYATNHMINGAYQLHLSTFLPVVKLSKFTTETYTWHLSLYARRHRTLESHCAPEVEKGARGVWG